MHTTAPDLPATMTALGHLAQRRQLAALGHGRRMVDRALTAGTLVPVRPGWVATPAASQAAVIAVLRGARVTGATALRSHGIWSGSDSRLHLQLPRNAHRIRQEPLTPLSRFTRPRFPISGVVTGWTTVPAVPATGAQWRVPVADALRHFARAESPEQVVAAVESAEHLRRLSRTDACTLLSRLPRRFGRLERRATFHADSGLESVGRMRLEDLGIVGRQQAWIGQDRVDLLIDNWLVIEWDGDEWHDPAMDRIRTNRLIRAGYRVLRFGYAEVFDRWPETVATILEVLGSGAPR